MVARPCASSSAMTTNSHSKFTARKRKMPLRTGGTSTNKKRCECSVAQCRLFFVPLLERSHADDGGQVVGGGRPWHHRACGSDSHSAGGVSALRLPLPQKERPAAWL